MGLYNHLCTKSKLENDCKIHKGETVMPFTVKEILQLHREETRPPYDLLTSTERVLHQIGYDLTKTEDVTERDILSIDYK
tara:strand:- start:25039 stop:25278 length:240 start_codon:yes stop_codon:yes gene_type:complete